jgi:hypothetical protein
LVGLTGAPGDDLGQIGFAYARITDETHAGAVAQEVEIEQAKDAMRNVC